MSPDLEKELVRKVDAIYIALFGIDGQPDTGRIQVLEKTVGVGKFNEDPTSHAARISKLESYRFYIAGAIGAVCFLAGLAVKALAGR